MDANTATGVREYGLGRHLWALKPEQAVGFEKVKTPRKCPDFHARCILIYRYSFGIQLARSNVPPSC